MNIDSLWTKFLSSIKSQLSSLSYDTWFSTAKLVELKDDNLVITVQSLSQKKHLIEFYMDIVQETFQDITGNLYNIEFILESEYEEENQDFEVLEEVSSNNEEIVNNYENTNLNPEYTFDNFVIGDSNKFAQATALAVAKNPGNLYNPLFIYGNSGLGKTHLMHAIGNYIVENSNKKVLYVTSDQFMTDFVKMNSKRKDNNNFDYIDFFKDKYRNVDVLIIDDIQFLGTASQSQNEFFHTFNSLHDNKKQIIISSDNSPDDLKHFEERLKTRFNSGLKVNIFPPDVELRKLILRRKLANMEFEKQITDEAIDYMANICDSDVRKLEGDLIRVCAYSTIFFDEDISLDLVVEALKDSSSKSSNYKNDIQKIQRVVAEQYNVTVEDLKSNRRMKTITFPRQIAIYLSRLLTDESLPRIGMEFGGRDHSTVIHSCEKIEKDLKTNKQLEKIIEEIKAKL